MNYISLFSGALGLDLGLEKAGFSPLLYCEVDKYCSETITLNKPNVPLIHNILDYQASDIKRLVNNEHIDLVVGGPPCQAFSTAGNRNAFNDPRGNLIIKFLSIACDLNPEFIVMENVRGILSTPIRIIPDEYKFNGLNIDPLKSGSVMSFVKQFLIHHGYSVSFNLYNAVYFGVPQSRERLILIACKSPIKMPYLTPTHSTDGTLNAINDLKSCIGDLKNIEHSYIPFPEKRLRFYKMLQAGQNWRNLPNEELKIEALGKAYFLGGGKTGFLRRLDWDKPSPTLVTHPCMPATDLGHPTEDRPLSVQEYARIQQFPDNWKFCGRTIQQYKQIGNAVPVGLGYAIAKRLIDGHLKNPIIENFKFSRYKNTTEHYF